MKSKVDNFNVGNKRLPCLILSERGNIILAISGDVTDFFHGICLVPAKSTMCVIGTVGTFKGDKILEKDSVVTLENDL